MRGVLAKDIVWVEGHAGTRLLRQSADRLCACLFWTCLEEEVREEGVPDDE